MIPTKRKGSLFNVNVDMLCPVLLAAIIAAVCFGTLPLTANGPNEEFEMEQSIRLFMKERNAALKEQSKLKISASAGFTGHKSGESNLYQLGLGVGVVKEMYPGEFEFRTTTSLVIQDSKLQENVTTFNMSYDHYLTPWLETYGFLERFSNTFLGLQYRYEIGGGFKAEFNMLPGKWKKKNDTSRRILKKYQKLTGCLEERDGDGTLLKQLEQLERQEIALIKAGRRDRSLLTLGMAVSFFAELAKPANAVILDPAEAYAEQEKFRVAFRPSFKFRPSDMITLSGQFYYKYPLFKAESPGGPLQYRTDTILRAALNLTAGASWTKSAALVFEYQRHYDNNPFGSLIVPNQSNVNPDVVNKSHDTFLIQLNFEF